MHSNSILISALTLCQSIFSVPMEETSASLERRTFGFENILASKFAAKKQFMEAMLGKKYGKDEYSNNRCETGIESVCESVCQRNSHASGCEIYNCTLDSRTPNCKAIVCKKYPFSPGCSSDDNKYNDKCERNPNAPGCQEDVCEHNPRSPGCYNGEVEKPTKPVSPPVYTPTNNHGSAKYH